MSRERSKSLNRRESKRVPISNKKLFPIPSVSESEDGYDDDFDNDLAIESKRAIAYLQIHRKYRYVEFLAQGGYGWVSLVYDDRNQRSLAVKCTTDTTDMETGWWPKLHHRNILPLIEYITLDSCTVFIMPAMRRDLWMCVSEEEFYHNELSFGLCRVWLRDVAAALEYLHGLHLCHLDLKLDNVFLKHDGYACLGDFSLLSHIDEVPSDFHFLDEYEPPEFTDWCHGTPPPSLQQLHPMAGDKADMWQYGILALDLLTKMSLTGSRGSNDLTLWHHDVWPFVQKVLLHREYLEFLLEATFVNVIFQKEEIEQVHALLSGLLNIEPDLRMEAGEVRRHQFLDIEWPQLPSSFALPQLIIEHPKPERSSSENFELREKDSKIGWEEALERQKRKLQNRKVKRRQTIMEETGKSLLNARWKDSMESTSSNTNLTVIPEEADQPEPAPSSKKTPTRKKTPKRKKTVPVSREGSVTIFLPKPLGPRPDKREKPTGFQMRLGPEPPAKDVPEDDSEVIVTDSDDKADELENEH